MTNICESHYKVRLVKIDIYYSEVSPDKLQTIYPGPLTRKLRSQDKLCWKFYNFFSLKWE